MIGIKDAYLPIHLLDLGVDPALVSADFLRHHDQLLRKVATENTALLKDFGLDSSVYFKIHSSDATSIVEEIERGCGLLGEAHLVQHAGCELFAHTVAVVQEHIWPDQAPDILEEFVELSSGFAVSHPG